jgi:MOSC domain-containing protein YiiM
MKSIAEILVEAGKGIMGEPRYFGRLSSTTGKPSLRQLSLIEREQLDEHAASLGLPGIDPGAARSNIETEGLQLGKLIGREVRVGEAVVRFYEPRKPCSKMDAICQGLRTLMEDGKQGVMAEIIQGGRIRVGDPIRLLDGNSINS